MPAIMADHDVEGDFDIVLRTLMSGEWSDLWNELNYDVESFMSLGISDDTSDVDLWRLCQERQIILITGNRNREGPISLQYAIEQFNTPACLPVLTLGDPGRAIRSQDYLHRLVARLVEYLIDIESVRGAGRLYLP